MCTCVLTACFSFSSFYSNRPLVDMDALIMHGLHALRETLQQDKELNLKNCSIGVVGKDHDWEVIEGDRLKAYLDQLESGSSTGAAAEDLPQGEAMDTE